ncbi:MAG: carboxypeptidase-like regulatory domain-containing protein [Candidatus Diapherotrites archaeon]
MALEALKEKWVAFSDWLEEKGIPVPLFFLLILLLVVGIIYFAFPELFGVVAPPKDAKLTVTVVDSESNALKDAIVKVVENKVQLGEEQKTNSEGKTEFIIKGGAGKTVTVIAKYGEVEGSKDVKLSETSNNPKITLKVKPAIASFSKTVRFLDKDGSIIRKNVSFSALCEGNPSFSKTQLQTGSGEYTLSEIPGDCGNLKISVSEVGGSVNFSEGQFRGAVSASIEPVNVKIIEEAKKGTIIVYVKKKDGGDFDSSKNCRVSLEAIEGGDYVPSQTTESTGSAKFENVTPGTYSASVSCSGYKAVPSTDKKTLAPGGKISFDLYVEDAQQFSVKFLVYEKGNKSKKVEGIALELKDSASKYVGSCTTDKSGVCTIIVPENKQYTLYAKKGTIAVKLSDNTANKVSPRDTAYEFYYDAALEENPNMLIVTVKEADSKAPIEGAKIELFFATGELIGQTANITGFTGADGKLEFASVPAGSYFIQASVSTFQPGKSGTFTIEETQEKPKEVSLELTIPKGNFSIAVVNSSNQAMPNASIKAVNIVDGATINTVKSDKDGMAKMSIRADKRPFFIVELPGYLPFVTTIFRPVAGVTTEIKALLLEETSALSVKLEGLYKENALVKDSVESGQAYTARLLLVVPNKGYASAGIHFRAGSDEEGKTTLASDDIIAVGAVESVAQRIVRSVSYSPPNGAASDTAKLAGASEAAKWTEIEWLLGKNGLPEFGVFSATVEVLIDAMATEGDLAKISYRGWGAKTTYDRDPVDSVLGTSANASTKQGLYAKAYDVVYSLGQANLCLEGYCRIVSIEDLATKSKVSVFDKASLNISSAYRLNFTINKQAATSTKNAKISISGKEKGLRFGNYSVKDALGGTTPGKASGFSISTDIGTLDQYKTISGWIEFETVKSGVTNLVIAIESEKGIEMQQSIAVTVQPGKTMKIDFVPKEIIPVLDNQMVFRVFEETIVESEETEEGEKPVTEKVQVGVPEASISILLDGIPIGGGFTDSEGMFPLKIEAPKAGSKVKVSAAKPGYKPVEREILIDDKIITVIPPKISLDMMANSGQSAKIKFSIENGSAITLKVSSLTLAKEIAPYLLIKSPEQLVGKEIEAGKTLEAELDVELTKEGINTEKPVNLDSKLSIEVESTEFSRKWVSDLGIAFRILLGQQTDNKDCLSITPTEWKFSTYGADKKITLEVKNNCTANSKPVSLKDFEVAIAWADETMPGEFRLSSDSFTEEGKTDIALSDAFAKISSTIPAEFEGTLTLSFKPSSATKSAESNPEISFRAKHVSEKGIEKLKASVKVSLLVNKLAECLQIIKESEEIELKTLPYNYGWGIVQDYFDKDPYAETTGTGQGQQNPYSNPTTQYQSPWGTTYGYPPWSTQTYQWQTRDGEAEEGSFKLENSCKEAVQVSLSTRAGLEIEEKEFEIASGASKDVVFTPTTKIGKFEIKVRAKLKSESAFYKEIGSVKVRVLRFEEISEKCKPTVEPTYFTATFLGWQMSAGRIINNCVDLGYKLKPLTRERFHCYKPPQGTDMTGTCPLIEAVWSQSPVVQKINEDQSIEVLEFGLKFNPNITEQMQIPMEGPIEKRVGKLRIVFSNLANSLISPGIISIPILTPEGKEKFIPREVTFEDPFEWIGVIGMLINSGDPDKLPEECIFNKNYFVLESWGAEWKELKDTHFTENRFAWKEKVPKREMVLPYAISNDEVLDKKYCGSTDKIQSVTPPTLEDSESGLRLSFNITENGHHVVMVVDRSQMATKCAKIDRTITLTVKRAFYKTDAAEVKMPVKLTVLNKGVTAYTAGCENQPLEAKPKPDWASNTACTSLETGPEAFTKLGFDRIKFNWRAGEIPANACDPIIAGTTTANPKYIFCDAVQFSLALSKKFNETRALADKISQQLQEDPLMSKTVSVIAQDSALVKEINSTPGKLYKIYKKQLAVHDNETGKDYLLFLAEDTVDGSVSLLAPPKKANAVGCDTAKIQSDLTGWINALSTANEQSTAASLSSIPQKFAGMLSACYGTDIDGSNVIAIIPKTIDNSMAANPDTKILWEGMQGNIFEFEEGSGNSYLGIDAYIMTFEEYKKIHLELLAQWTSAKSAGEEDPTLVVQLGGTEFSALSSAWVKFLNNLNNSGISFQIGLRNRKAMSEAREAFVRDKAANAISASLENLAGSKVTMARLIKDNYSETFLKDFTSYYKDTGFSADQIKFELYDSYSAASGFEGGDQLLPVLPDSGEYYYRIEPVIALNLSGDNYSLVLKKIVVKMALNKGLVELSNSEGKVYDLNPFFYLPFDGEVGQGNTAADYGVGFASDVGSKIFYSNESQNNWFAAVPRMPGIITLTPNYSDKYDKVRSGSVLSINRTKGTFNYTPSYPVAIKAEWDGGTNNTIFYRLAPASYGDISKMNELFVWWQGTEARSDAFKETEGDPFCEGWTEKQRAAKVMFNNVSPWNSLAFMPANAGAFRFELLCAKQPTTITAQPFESEPVSTAKTTTSSGGSVALVEQAGRIVAIQDYIDRIPKGEICINKGRGFASGTVATLDLSWNTYIPGLTENFMPPPGGS